MTRAAAWLDELGAETKSFRFWKADSHRYEAARADRDRKKHRASGAIPLECKGDPARAQPCGFCVGCFKRKARWHRDRAKGHEQRFHRVAACGEDEVGHTHCEACQCDHGATKRTCEVWRVCTKCQKRRPRRPRPLPPCRHTSTYSTRTHPSPTQQLSVASRAVVVGCCCSHHVRLSWGTTATARRMAQSRRSRLGDYDVCYRNLKH